MSFKTEFKEFALKGNVIDLAVGVVIGGAFGKIVSSFVNDLVMPLLSLAIGKVNFNDLKVVISEAQGETAEVAFRYGAFIQTVIDFLIIALAIFFVVKGINKMKRKQEEAKAATPPKPTKTEELLTDIKQLLENK